MGCKITIADGVDTVVMEGIPSLQIGFSTIQGGGTVRRFLGGGAQPQHRWRKEQYTITGEDQVPAGLRHLNYDAELTITVETPLGVDVYTAYADGPTESWGLTSGVVAWSLVAWEN